MHAIILSILADTLLALFSFQKYAEPDVLFCDCFRHAGSIADRSVLESPASSPFRRILDFAVLNLRMKLGFLVHNGQSTLTPH